jgi:hypothetical protein
VWSAKIAVEPIGKRRGIAIRVAWPSWSKVRRKETVGKVTVAKDPVRHTPKK